MRWDEVGRGEVGWDEARWDEMGGGVQGVPSQVKSKSQVQSSQVASQVEPSQRSSQIKSSRESTGGAVMPRQGKRQVKSKIKSNQVTSGAYRPCRSCHSAASYL
jgi:hypothetical protein